MAESLGKTLKRVRESKHLSLEEVSERSRISKHIVSIIEEDRLSEITSGFYARSFVRTYASFLGCLDEPRVKEFMSTGAQQQPHKRPEPVSRTAAKPADKTPQVDFSIATKYKKQIAAVIIGIFAFLVLIFAIGEAGKFVKKISAKKQNKPAVIKKETPKKQEKEKPKEPAKEVKKEAVSEKPDFIEIEVSASENTYLQVTGDGELMFKGSFKKGSKDVWKAKKEIKLEMGNSGVIKIEMDGKPLSFIGKKGKKKEIIITKDGMR